MSFYAQGFCPKPQNVQRESALRGGGVEQVQSFSVGDGW